MDARAIVKGVLALVSAAFVLAVLFFDAGDVGRFALSHPVASDSIAFAARAMRPLDAPLAEAVRFIEGIPTGGLAEERYREILGGLFGAEWLAGRLEAMRALFWLLLLRAHMLLWHALLAAALWVTLAVDGAVMRRVRFAEYRAPGPETHEAAAAVAAAAAPVAALLLMMPFDGAETAACAVIAAGGIAVRQWAGSFHRYL